MQNQPLLICHCLEIIGYLLTSFFYEKNVYAYLNDLIFWRILLRCSFVIDGEMNVCWSFVVTSCPVFTPTSDVPPYTSETERFKQIFEQILQHFSRFDAL